MLLFFHAILGLKIEKGLEIRDCFRSGKFLRDRRLCARFELPNELLFSLSYEFPIPVLHLLSNVWETACLEEKMRF